MNPTPSRPLWLCVATLALQHTIFAVDVYYTVPIASLTLTEGSLPAPGSAGGTRNWQLVNVMPAYAVLDDAGEVFVGDSASPWGRTSGNSATETISVRAPENKEVTGRLFVPKADFSGLLQVRFKISPEAAKPEAKNIFLTAKEQYYRGLLNQNLPGAAWFRHEAEAAANERGVSNNAAGNFNRGFDRRNASELEDTFNLFTGGRALSENLQLDRILTMTGGNNSPQTIALTNLNGITIQAMDWKPLLNATKPELDPLAAFIPADQYALFFPSFQAMTEMMDEADANGTPVLQMLEPRSEDANARGRYQRQLCLELNDLSRLLGPQVVTSEAFTGSDPFLRMGTDVAILFEAKNPQLLQAGIIARHTAARTANPAAKSVSGIIEGVPYTGVVSPDRAISSYLAAVSNVVFVSNSPKQLENLVRTAQGKLAGLSSQDEYIFFRQKYPRGDKNETAFLVLSDATIRRWCGPQWRIADSRRTRAAAVLSELQAAHLDELVRGSTAAEVLSSAYPLPDSGELRLTPGGVVSSTYGTLDFMTPIAEIPLTKVTSAEAEAYGRWRDTYQQNARQVFDPVALRFSISPRQLGAALTVMPLIAASRYNEFIGFSSGAQIAANAGDPHTDALARLAFAVNTQSKPVQDAGNMVGNFAPGLKANFLGWLGQAVTLYADDDPFWNELGAATNVNVFMEHSYARLPLALHCEVKNSLGVVAFLTALHVFVDQSAPKMTVWQNLEYHGKPYVKVASAKASAQADPEDDWVVYYAVTPDSLMVTLSEPLLKRALDRQAARDSADKPALAGVKPWLGSNICFQAEQKFIDVLLKATHENYQTHQQLLAWNNLPVLNEWKRLYPDQDPVKLHEQLWGVKLICPGGGTYVWNEKWHTMESTVFGHPGEPKSGPASLFSKMTGGNLGVTFENQGLSAKAVIDRISTK